MPEYFLSYIARHANVPAFGRFVIIGAIAAASYAAIATCLVHWKLAEPLTASVSTYAAIIPVAYILQRRFAFNSNAGIASSFGLYSLLQISVISFVSYVTTRYVRGTPWVDALLFLGTAGISAILSFVLSSLIFTSRGEVER